MLTTRIFDRLPSDAGITFEGFEDIKLESRESVRVKLKEFIEYCKDARKPAIRVILGEWGEGKTDAYRRYIEPKAKKDNNYAFFVSASTLSNGYDIPAISSLLETTSLSAVKFLVVLFACIREESKEERIPEPEKFQDAHAYLNTTLKNLITNQKTRRIFIFIDEFEELLLNPPRLREIISGIKETINGRYTTIDEGGEYEGCLHLIIAATPDAYYRLQVDEETSLIFGGLGRRAGVIELPQIRKEEGINFLFALLNYAYNNNLPHPLPLTNLGIFHALFRIAQGNPGNMVSLFTRLINSARVNREHLKVIDGEHLLDFLEKEDVFVYGGRTSCLETETFYRILKVIQDQRIREIGKKCSDLMEILVGELKPFSVEELENRIGKENIKNLINIINDDLKRREGIERAILKVCPLREGKGFPDVETVFKEYITVEGDIKYIKIDNYSEKLEDFEDRVTFFTLEENDISSRIYLPSERNSIMSFFEGTTHDRAIEIEHLLNRRLCKNEAYHLASEELLSQIFPTPIPRELDFIRNREVRMKLWRDVTKNLAEEYEMNMPAALIHLLNMSKKFKVTETGKHMLKSPARFAELSVDEVKINTMFFSVNGDVKSSDVEELHRLVKGRKPPIHCVILLFTGEITPEAEDKIINKELGKDGENLILEIRVHPTLSKRIICIYKAHFMQEEVDEGLLSSVITKLVTQEFDFPAKIKNWLEEQKGKGVVILDLPIEATSNLREFADTLKFFINFMDYETTPKEIFDKNREELLEFIKYEAKKIGLIPDIEFPKFSRIVEDLTNNGFLLRSNGKFKIQPHPVEKRIIKILEKETKLSNKELEDFFILKKARFLSDVFLPILEYKGSIRREGNNYMLNDKNQLFSEVESGYSRFKKLVKIGKYQKYGYIYMTKERGCRFISLKKFEEFVDGIYYKLQETSGVNEEITLQKLSLLKKLLEHFTEEFIPLFDRASHSGESILIDANSLYARVKDLLDSVKSECSKWLKVDFDLENMEEYKEIKETYENVERYVKADGKNIDDFTRKFTEEEKRIFYFRNNEEDAYFFNPKLYKIMLSKKEMDKIARDIEKRAEDLNGQFQTLNQLLTQLEHEIRNKTIDEGYKISHSILNVLKQLSKDVLHQVQPMVLRMVNLKHLMQIAAQNIQPIASNLNSLTTCLTYLDDLLKSEEKFVGLLEEGRELSFHILSIFDINEYSTVAKNFELALDRITNQYEACLEDIHLEDAKSLSQKILNFGPKIGKFSREVNDEETVVDTAWKNYVNSMNDFISNIRYILKLLQKVHKIDTKEVEDKLDEITEYTKVKEVINLKLKLSRLERIKNETRDILYKTIKAILTEKEFRLLEFLITKTKMERREWLPLTEFYQFAKRELKMKTEEANDALRKLINQGLLKEGVSLAF